MAATQGHNGLNRTDVAVDPVAAGMSGTSGTSHATGHAEHGQSEEIRRDIDRTRGAMDRTIDQLTERLQPRNLFEDVVDAVRGSLFSGSSAANCPPGTVPRSTASGLSSGLSSGLPNRDQVADTASRVGRTVLESIKENPVPAALMGAGLAWLLFEDKARDAYTRSHLEHERRRYTGDRYRDPGTHSGSYVDARTGEPYDAGYGAGYRDLDHDGEPDEMPRTAADRARDAASSAKGAVSSAADAISSAASTVGHAVHKVGDVVGGAAGKAKHVAGKASHVASRTGRSARVAGQRVGEFGRTAGSSVRTTGASVGEFGRTAGTSVRQYGRSTASTVRQTSRSVADTTRHGVEYGREQFNTSLEESPLAVGVAALAAGLLAGFALPTTRVENRTFGRQADRLKDEARRRGEEVLEQGKEAASGIASHALDTAEDEGLTPGTLADKAAKIARDALNAAKESAREEGLDARSLKEKAAHVGQAVKQEAVGASQGVSNESGRLQQDVKEIASDLTTDLGTSSSMTGTSSMSGDACRLPTDDMGTKI